MNEPPSPSTLCPKASEPENSVSPEPPLDAGSRADGPLFLVPTDFSPESYRAVQYAASLAEQVGGRVHVLHVDAPDAAAHASAHAMRTMLEELDLPLRPSVECVRGSLAEELSGTAQRMGADYIVVTSRHMRDPEQFKQSTVLQLLRYGNVPYLALQEPPEHGTIRDVVVPIDYSSEERIRHEWIPRLCAQYSPRFHLVVPSVNEADLHDRIEENLEYTQELLDQAGAEHEEHRLDGLDDYTPALLNYALGAGADLIVLTSTPDPRHAGRYMLEPHDRALLQQAEGIAVMVINPIQEGAAC